MMSFRRFAVGAGVEPAHSDLINDKLAGFVVNPYHLSISFSAPTRRVGVYTNGIRRFTTLQFAERQGFEPQNLLQLPVFKTGAFNHSAIFPLQWCE